MQLRRARVAGVARRGAGDPPLGARRARDPPRAGPRGDDARGDGDAPAARVAARRRARARRGALAAVRDGRGLQDPQRRGQPAFARRLGKPRLRRPGSARGGGGGRGRRLAAAAARRSGFVG